MVVFLLKFVIFSQVKCVEIFSADRLFLWTHSLAEPTTSESKYSGLHFAQTVLFLLPVRFQSCARLWRTILQIVFHTNLLIFNIEKVADFSLSPT